MKSRFELRWLRAIVFKLSFIFFLSQHIQPFGDETPFNLLSILRGALWERAVAADPLYVVASPEINGCWFLIQLGSPLYFEKPEWNRCIFFHVTFDINLSLASNGTRLPLFGPGSPFGKKTNNVSLLFFGMSASSLFLSRSQKKFVSDLFLYAAFLARLGKSRSCYGLASFISV